MANYTIRIELHGASAQDYLRLHDAMFQIGAKIYIEGDNGVAYQMPSAEYDLENTGLSAAQVRDVAYEIARRFTPNPWVLVTEVASRAWVLRPLNAANVA